MQSVRTAVVPLRWARRLAHVYWPMVLWSAAAGGAGGLLGWALAEPLAAANSPEPTYAIYLGVARYFLVLSLAVGALLGGLPGVLNRSVRQAVRGAVLAGLVGALGGALGAVPAQDRVRGDQQPQPMAARFRYHAEQGREQGTVRPVQSRAAWPPPLQDGELMAQDQDLRGLPRILTPRQPQPHCDPRDQEEHEPQAHDR